jgi:PAS domain S-box-containing protein
MTLDRRLRRPAGCAAWIVAAASAVVLLPAAAFPATVLIVRGESPDLPGGTIVVEQITSVVRQEFPGPVEFLIETFDASRFPTVAHEARFAELLEEKYSGLRLDLVIAFTEPAVDFVLRERSRLFPDAPLLLGHVEERTLGKWKIPESAAVVAVELDAAATLRLALANNPLTRRVLVVGGTSRFDREWMRIVREDLREFDKWLAIAFDTESRVEDLARKVAELPRDTIVLYVSMTRDAGDGARRPPDVAQLLRDASSVPIYGLSSTYLGRGIVGGALMDLTRHGRDLGHQAVHRLKGESPHAVITPASVAIDWREMQRFKMPLDNLPPATVVAFRERNLYERARGFILVVSLVVAVESALIFGLVRLGKRRRETQRQLQTRLRYDRLLLEFALTLTAASPTAVMTAVQAALNRLGAGLGFDRVFHWRFDGTADGAWDCPSLRAGQPTYSNDPAAMPPEIQQELGPNGGGSCASVAVPLVRDGVSQGALFWISRAPQSSWPLTYQHLQMVAMIVGNVLQLSEADRAFEQSDRLKGAILDSLPAHVAVLDRAGKIIAVNRAWMAFGRDNGVASDATISAGVNYLEVCRKAAAEGSEGASDAVALIEAVCAGERRERPEIEYACSSREAERWFLMRVEPLRRAERGAVVTHSDITKRKLSEIALRESEGRFRRLADSLPVAVWMSDTDASHNYFNKPWLELTGRTLSAELGVGWLENVHPDDRATCQGTYLRAFHARQPFESEYRLRQHDGCYRWLFDAGVPRYGSDGSFHGYVGGAIDISERKKAVEVLRDVNRRLIVAQEEERRRIARELHDHLNQQLALLAIDLQTAVKTGGPLARKLQEAWQRTSDIASDVHAISHRLHPSKLETLGLSATIRAHCRDLSRQGVSVQFSEQNVPVDIPRDVAVCLFRVFEEALSNVVRHSGAAQAQVTLSCVEPDVVLRVSDAGRGFALDSQGASGLGLVSMRERLVSLGGALTVSSAPGRGTVVEARVPRISSHRADYVLDLSA